MTLELLKRNADTAEFDQALVEFATQLADDDPCWRKHATLRQLIRQLAIFKFKSTYKQYEEEVSGWDGYYEFEGHPALTIFKDKVGNNFYSW